MRADGEGGEVDGKLDAAELHALFAAEGWDAERAQRAVVRSPKTAVAAGNDWVAAMDLNTTTSQRSRRRCARCLKNLTVTVPARSARMSSVLTLGR